MASWLKQQIDAPLYPDMLWSRPENKQAAGKLLIVGGNRHSFSAVNQAYSEAKAAGIGTTRVALPDSLEKSLGKVFPEAQFAPSNLSGSFSKQALDRLLDTANWADGVLLPGDLGKNSETAIVLEKFIKEFNGPLGIAGDSLDYFFNQEQMLLERPNTVLIASFDQLQRLLAKHVALKHSMNLHQLIDALPSVDAKAILVTGFAEQLVVTSAALVSTTLAPSLDLVKAATFSAVWLAQQPARPFEAVTTAVFCATTSYN